MVLCVSCPNSWTRLCAYTLVSFSGALPHYSLSRDFWAGPRIELWLWHHQDERLKLLNRKDLLWPQRVKTSSGESNFQRASSSKAKVSRDNSPLNQKIQLQVSWVQDKERMLAKRMLSFKWVVGDLGIQTGLLILITLESGIESGYWEWMCLWAGEEQAGELQVKPLHLVTGETGGW